MLSSKHKEGSEMNKININTTSVHTHTSTTNTATTTNNDNSEFPHSPHSHHFRRGISRLLQQSTIHGLPHLSTSSNEFVRFIWFTLWLVSVIGFSINLAFVLTHYISQPVLTSYRENYEEFIWPDIIFCNAMAPYTLNTQERRVLWNYYVNWARNLSRMNSIPEDLFMTIDPIHPNETMIQSLVHSSIPYWRFNIDDVEDMFGFIGQEDIHEGRIWLSIGKDAKTTHMPKPWENYFYTQILQKRYNIPCLNFQIARNLNESEVNRTKALGFFIKSNLQSYLLINSSYYSHIIDVYITLPNHFPGTTTVIELTPGYIHHIQLEMIRHRNIQKNGKCQNRKYSAIIYDANLITKRLVYSNSGSDDLCYRLLSQYLYVKECHCYSPFLPYGYFPDLINISYNNINTNNTSINGSISQPVLCLNMSIFDEYVLAENSKCMYRVFKRYSNSRLYSSLKEAKQCEYYAKSRYCNEVKYNHLGMASRPVAELWGNAYNEARGNYTIRLFADNFMKENNNNNNHSYYVDEYNRSEYNKNISQNELKLEDFFFRLRNNIVTLTVECVNPQGRLFLEEDEYPLSRLISDIGGNMGLWIGISVIGLFECFQLIGFTMYALVNYFKR